MTAPLVSWGTLISGALFFAALCLSAPWRPALWFVLFMYAHEAGHVLAARWRRVSITRPPVFIPGLGAYVRVDGADKTWDDVIVSLGGPVVGAAAAVLALLVCEYAPYDILGYRFEIALGELGWAAGFALFINTFNLIPLRPFDGGRVAARAGWAGLVLALGAAAVAFFGPIKFGWLVTALCVFGVSTAYVTLERHIPLRTQAAVLAAFAATAALLSGGMALFWSWVSSGLPLFRTSPAGSLLFNVALALYACGILSELVASLRAVPAWIRYPLSGLLGWPYNLFDSWEKVPVAWAITLQLLGLPGLRLLFPLIRYWSDRRDSAAPYAAACGYDTLHNDPAARAEWLEQVSPLLRQAGAQAMMHFCTVVVRLGHGSFTLDWVFRQVRYLSGEERIRLAAMMRANQANHIAWQLVVGGDAEEALPFAEKAVAKLPEDAASLDTLARVRLAMDDPAAAEALLRKALSILEHLGSRVALARALAAQACYEDAVIEATRALTTQTATWPEDEPSQDQVRAWIDEWRTLALASATTSPEAPAAGAPV